ncbi:fimbrial protein [Lelliottia nimipressuralis]|uniref:fimbrial protein n=1 Tax=Lelliottia nimipressuralis TaxID=69220 RepID=UPI003559347B
MKLSALCLSLGFTAVMMSGSAMAINQGGKVTFTGNITDSACSISPESSDQTVDLGQISIKDLTDGDKTTKPRDFDITLENCVLDQDGANTVTVTFGGTSSEFEPGILGVSGTASGVGVAIAEQNSSSGFLPLNTPSKAMDIMNGSNTMHFSAYLMGDESATPTEGEFTAVANFILAYQ